MTHLSGPWGEDLAQRGADPDEQPDDYPEPPMTASEWAEATAYEDALERGAYDDIAPPPAGPPCQHDGCGLTLASAGRRWWHQENLRADHDHDAQPCPCATVGGIVADADPWCPLHGHEDVRSGAVWADPHVYRELARELAQHAR